MLYEIVAGECTAYPDSHHVQHHTTRLHDLHYGFPCDAVKLNVALRKHIECCDNTPSTSRRSSFAIRTKVILNLLTYPVTREYPERVYDYEHMVAFKQCKDLSSKENHAGRPHWKLCPVGRDSEPRQGRLDNH